MTGPYRATICKFWVQGLCTKGDECTWAHDEFAKPPSAEAEPPLVPWGPLPAATPQTKPRAAAGHPAGRVKTVLCKYWQQGDCRKEVGCTFAHGENEIGQPIEATADAGGFGPDFETNDKSVKRTICKFWLEGRCLKDAECGFAHGEEDFGKPIGEPPGFVPQLGKAVLPSAQPVFWSEPKRTLCKFWQEGRCQKGDTCGFAHGDQDIGNPIPDSATAVAWPGVQAPPAAEVVATVKKTICKFWQENRCQAGASCTFAHGQQEVGTIAHTAFEVTPPWPVDRRGPVDLRAFSVPCAAAAAPSVATKRTLCKFFLQGACTAGAACTWAHGQGDLGTPLMTAQQPPPKSTPWTMLQPKITSVVPAKPWGHQNAAMPAMAALPEATGETPSVKKTLCKFWTEGKCVNGLECTWAHGEQELGMPIAKQELGAPFAKGAGAQLLLPGGAPRPTPPWAVGGGAGGGTGVDAGVGAGGDAGPGGGGGLAAPAAEERGVKRTICKFWVEGKCDKGLGCTWAHGENDVGAPIVTLGGESLVDHSDTPCKYFFNQGSCNKGSACPFSHDEGLSAAKRMKL